MSIAGAILGRLVVLERVQFQVPTIVTRLKQPVVDVERVQC
jgi:hypothetical protein